MRYIVYYARSLVLIVLTVSTGWWLATRIGTWPTLLAFVLFAGVAAGIGAALLRSSTVGKLTWKNRLAGFLVPWGWMLARGQLWRGVTASGIVWVMLGGVGTFLAWSPVSMPIAATPNTTLSTVLTALLALAWVVDGGAILYLVSTVVKNFTPGSKPSRPILKILAFCIVILIGSIVLHLTGHSYLALFVAAGPPFAAASVMGLYLLAILLAGKNLRWN